MGTSLLCTHTPYFGCFHRNIFTLDLSLAVEETGLKGNPYQLAKLLCFQKDDTQVVEHLSWDSGGRFSSHEADLVLGN